MNSEELLDNYCKNLSSYRYLFNIYKSIDELDYSELFVIYKNCTCSDLYKQISFHFNFNISKLTFLSIKLAIPNSSLTLQKYISDNNILVNSSDPPIYNLVIG